MSLKLENVSFVYGGGTPFEKKALDNVNIEFKSGKITGLIGHTGSGKSTVAQLLNGLLKPSSGKILLDGYDIWEKPEEIGKVRFRVGLVFQYPEYQLFEETVYKDIAFGPKNMSMTDKEIDVAVRNAANFAKLDSELLEKSPFELSGGQKRRVAIAGIMAMNPQVIVLDEPAAGLDPGGRESIFRGIREYHENTGNTVILISHSMEDMAMYADELVVMREGKVLSSGTVDEIFENAEIIRQSGLNIPQITSFMLLIKKLGLDVNTAVYTVENAVDEIINLLNSCKERHK